jgi:hypothetical protein
MCRNGKALYDDMKACQADLARERELAKAPIPGQEGLFADEDLKGLVVSPGGRVNSV